MLPNFLVIGAMKAGTSSLHRYLRLHPQVFMTENHDTDRATNGRIEGTNNKLGVLKRIAYGFVNNTNFAARALLLTPGMTTSP